MLRKFFIIRFVFLFLIVGLMPSYAATICSLAESANPDGTSYGSPEAPFLNSFNKDGLTKVAIHISSQKATEWAGSLVESVRVPLKRSYPGDFVNIWISEGSYDAEPIVIEHLDLQKTISYSGVYDLVFEKQYTIKPGVDFYIGYTTGDTQGTSCLFLWQSAGFQSNDNFKDDIIVGIGRRNIKTGNEVSLENQSKSIGPEQEYNWYDAYCYPQGLDPYIRYTISNAHKESIATPGKSSISDPSLQDKINFGSPCAPIMSPEIIIGSTKVGYHVSTQRSKEWAGSKVESIRIPLRSLSAESHIIKIWISEDGYDAEPTYMESVDLSETILCGGLYDIYFDKPYEIKADTDFYIGYTVENDNGKSLIALWSPDDAWLHKFEKDIMAYSSMDYVHYGGPGPDKGYDLFEPTGKSSWQQAYFYPDEKQPYLRFSISDSSGNSYKIVADKCICPRQVQPAETNNIQLTLRNSGLNDISSATFEVKVGDADPQHHMWQSYKNLSYDDVSDTSIPIVCGQTGIDVPLSVSVVSINDKNVGKYNIFNGFITCINSGYDPNMVITTKTLDTQKYKGIKMLGQKTSPNVYPVVLSTLNGVNVFEDEEKLYNGEKIGWRKYMDFFSNMDLFCNQWFAEPLDSDISYLESMYQARKESMACAEIQAELHAIPDNDRFVKIIARTRFTHNFANSRYGIGYIILEDGVNYGINLDGDNSESDNYISSGSSLNKPTYISVTRAGSRPDGIESSLPEYIKAEEVYETAIDVNLDYVGDLSKYRILPLIVRMDTGEIVNVCELKSPNYSIVAMPETDHEFIVYGSTGHIVIGNGISADIYSIDGAHYASTDNGGHISVPAGIYIVTHNKRRVKVMVK